jgi:hypothetical protein
MVRKTLSYRLPLYRLRTDHTENTASVGDDVFLDVLLLRASVLRDVFTDPLLSNELPLVRCYFGFLGSLLSRCLETAHMSQYFLLPPIIK